MIADSRKTTSFDFLANDDYPLRTHLLLVALCACLLALPAAALEVRDAQGRVVVLARPAARVIALSPHLTEVVFAVGGAAALVAVSDHSDYPHAARSLPRVGDAFNLQLESLLALRPELVLLWGASGRGLAPELLERRGVALYVSEPRRLGDVATELRAIGRLLGRAALAERAARAYEARLAGIRPLAQPRRVLLQLGAPSLYTIGDRHYLGEALRLCGAVNVFGALRGNAPLVSVEAALATRPDIVLLLDNLPPSARASWVARNLRDVRDVPADLLSRPGPRLALGVQQMCSVLQR